MMHTCREVTEVASDYLDGTVSWSDWALLKAHLALCPPCKEYVEQLGITIEALRDLEAPEQDQARADLTRIFQAWKADPSSLPDVPDLSDPESPEPRESADEG
jgi:predicted anti-sigma-YlaC factor YlaD